MFLLGSSVVKAEVLKAGKVQSMDATSSKYLLFVCIRRTFRVKLTVKNIFRWDFFKIGFS